LQKGKPAENISMPFQMACHSRGRNPANKTGGDSRLLGNDRLYEIFLPFEHSLPLLSCPAVGERKELHVKLENLMGRFLLRFYHMQDFFFKRLHPLFDTGKHLMRATDGHTTDFSFVNRHALERFLRPRYHLTVEIAHNQRADFRGCLYNTFRRLELSIGITANKAVFLQNAQGLIGL